MKTLYACVAAVFIPCLAFGGMWMASPGKGSHAAAGGTPAYVQHWTAVSTLGGGGGSTSATTASLTTTTGNMLVAVVAAESDTYTVSDSKGNAWVRAVGPVSSGGGDQLSIWYAKNITGGASHTVTITFGVNRYSSICPAEYSGCSTTAPLDQTASGTGSGTSLSTSATGTTTQANEIVIGGGTILAVTSTWTAGSGFTLRGNQPSDSTSISALEDKQVSSTGTQTASMTFGNSAGWDCAVATFK